MVWGPYSCTEYIPTNGRCAHPASCLFRWRSQYTSSDTTLLALPHPGAHFSGLFPRRRGDVELGPYFPKTDNSNFRERVSMVLIYTLSCACVGDSPRYSPFNICRQFHFGSPPHSLLHPLGHALDRVGLPAPYRYSSC